MREKVARECSVDDCSISAIKRGMCNAHYQRWRKHGSAHGGSTSKGAAIAFFEMAKEFEGDECLTWPFVRDGNGRGRIRLDGGMKLVHREVCRAHHGEPPTDSHQSAHSCGKGHEGCVNPKHLRWATRQENESDKFLHGTHNRGDRNKRAILTIEDVATIRKLRGKILQRQLADQYGVARQTISDVQREKNWGWLDQDGK